MSTEKKIVLVVAVAVMIVGYMSWGPVDMPTAVAGTEFVIDGVAKAAEDMQWYGFSFENLFSFFK